MTKKITVSLDEGLVDELAQVAQELGKKKSQIVKEALQDFFDVESITRTVSQYKLGQLETISHDDLKAEFGL